MLVVCITSTEKLGNQLAMRDPARREVNIYNFTVADKVSNVSLDLSDSDHQSGRSGSVGCCVVWHLQQLLLGPCSPPHQRPVAGSSPDLRPR